MADIEPPTAADYAWATASSARDAVKELQGTTRQLMGILQNMQKRLDALEIRVANLDLGGK